MSDLLAVSNRRKNEVAIPKAKRVCLFAQYSRDGRLRPDTLAYIESLAAIGHVVHVAFSGASTVRDVDDAALRRVGARSYARTNFGLDFGAWKYLIGLGVAEHADEVLFANDSVIGPFMPLAPIFAVMAGFDAWGMVRSREGRPHLQSWFVSVTGRVFRHPRIQRVFGQDFESMTKDEIIVHGELGLGAGLDACGFDVGARYVSRFSVAPSALIASNPMHFEWRSLLTKRLVPFVKVELLRDNPVGAMGLRDLRDVVNHLGEGDDQTLRQREAVDQLLSEHRVGMLARRGLRSIAWNLATSADRRALALGALRRAMPSIR